MAVADGHGAARYIRSGEGSRIAADLGIEQLAELEIASRSATLSDIKRAATEQLPRKLHRTWIARVLEHLSVNPLSEQDHARLTASGARERDLQSRPEFMYGTTLLAALVTTSYAVFVQIGDGDLVVAWPSTQAGSVFTPDENQLGDQTHSLSSTNAWRHVQVLFQPLINEFPSLVLASTDGYGKAFRTQDDFVQVAADLKQMATDHGTEMVSAHLASWLAEAAEISGDDATAAIAIQVFEPLDQAAPLLADSNCTEVGSEAAPDETSDAPLTTAASENDPPAAQTLHESEDFLSESSSAPAGTVDGTETRFEGPEQAS